VEVRERRDLYRGFGDTMARAFELVVTPLLFALAGWALDRWLGTGPAFAVGLGLLAVVGMSLRLYYGYTAEMARHEQGAPWAPR